uniref:Uncharacterized protein n=1 Tax=Microcebus murinus TaxID=30608 RepID=A0A8C5VNB7_MICMU
MVLGPWHGSACGSHGAFSAGPERPWLVGALVLGEQRTVALRAWNAGSVPGLQQDTRVSGAHYSELKPVQSINAHPCNFDPMGKYFAIGSADALVSLWDVDELVCVWCFSRLDWPVRMLSFKDHFIGIAEVETGDKLWEVQCESLTFTVAWHPKRPLLAFACDDIDGKYDSSQEAGTVKLFGLPNDS